MSDLALDLVVIRAMTAADLDYAARIHETAFPRQSHSLEWVQCNFQAYPRMQYYVAEFNSQLLGFIHWTQKSGFRQEVVLELEQIAVHSDYQAKGIGQLLIKQSVAQLKRHLAERNAVIKRFLVSTRTDNSAQKLYRKTLNAKQEAIISNLYSADEVFMVGYL